MGTYAEMAAALDYDSPFAHALATANRRTLAMLDGPKALEYSDRRAIAEVYATMGDQGAREALRQLAE